MKEEVFVALVDELEGYARQNPAAYRLRVALLAALGYLFLFGIVALALIGVVGVYLYGRVSSIVYGLLAIPLIWAAFVLRSIWVKSLAPEGRELKYNDAPRLFDLVKELQAATKGPRVHTILLDDTYNAGIIQRARLGVFGWQKNYLTIGLPFLRALSVMDLRAVLAHEFGHLSGNHGKFTAWIYRVRQTWYQIMVNVQNSGRDELGIFTSFFNWYAPYFAAYSMVFARAQEFEADDCSVGLVGKECAARALINVELRGRALTEDFWPPFYKRADKESEPPTDTFSEMLQSMLQPIPPDKAQLWFSQSLTRRHSYDDTHPALGDRLELMGYDGVRQQADINLFNANQSEPRSDELLLGNVPAEFIEAKNRWWVEQLKTEWTGRYKFVAEAEQELATLADKATTTELTVEERWERARFMAGSQGSVAAIPFLNDVLALMPDHVPANYTLGEALLEQGDEAGIKHVEFAMDKDPKTIPSGCEAIYNFLMNRERSEEAEKYRQRVADYYDELELARQERDNVESDDHFDYHGLAAEALEALRAQLAKFPRLEAAHLVRKEVKHFPEEPSYVLGIISKQAWYKPQNNHTDLELINQLANEVQFPGYTFIVAMEHNYRWLRTVFKRIEGSLVYRS